MMVGSGLLESMSLFFLSLRRADGEEQVVSVGGVHDAVRHGRGVGLEEQVVQFQRAEVGPDRGPGDEAEAAHRIVQRLHRGSQAQVFGLLHLQVDQIQALQ
ncbi:hypothetical protein HPP92_010902 [Vanilla planifolia]|uniref:Uncharacterized protein n=1 Tax=Vanilla planifolia TaxID=51239 RepID=A0A835R0X1_VANPL|nr:hypothetical protein HPP92_010902 [Vanilla planifolia]